MDDYGVIRRGANKNIEAMRDKVLSDILSRLPTYNEKINDIVVARLRRYSDWHYPTMFIHPGNSELIYHVVSSDPVYILDEHYQLLEPVLKKFPPEYQRRLRKYVINETPDHPILDKIPDGQFFMCVAHNFFNYKPFEVLKRYLAEIYTKLRPGGVLVMTFNDCDRAPAVELAERTFACYTPGYLVRGMAESIGYQQGFELNDGGPWTWLELHKPGTLTTIKGGQPMAKRLPK